MEYLLHHFGKLIVFGPIMIVPASAAWLMLAHRRRRILSVRRSLVTAALDVSIALFGVWPSLLVTMPTSDESRVHLLPGTDLLMAASDQNAFWQLTANFSLLLPLGMLLPMRWTWWRSLRKATGAALLASFGIELTQYVAGIGRVASIDDVLVNTAGAAAGAALVILVINRPKIPDFSGMVSAPYFRPGTNRPVRSAGVAAARTATESLDPRTSGSAAPAPVARAPLVGTRPRLQHSRL